MDTHTGADRRVDVIIPAFNASGYIAGTLASVLAQTHAPARVIVVDDGSTDRTSEIVKEIIHGYQGPIKIELLEKANGGQSTARNLGIDHSEAPYLAFLDADDLWHSTKLEKQMLLFDHGGPDLGLVYS
ncbi:MAG: glycosyltransferase family 2 protein, partial [Bacteroidota bacterium]|nr:glycosyltransferase family 2 protein [Bacteroidota bacterium]